ncbi:bifunctional phosphoribosyl-AMP cyclohydrolase/phosphoribosyl-ATP diphosphatase HisIE [Psychroflexus gondwanensis]|uniref:Histidine biosynthesis bifunctional protein HisIE n=1 Tax=Psychroflexus gondwanensis ACAM 44 TaxID=1189619 RepID=N1WMM5_9FLAO|nr:bifunctional phosphoribosyl-AMP cyclohydrolase/phosphoribosyl-ATP diphosphatase HisIE [Psychroflexus gondwanensis]EMY81531.1 bifunctional phosphoribosyl-AMP cyclohydrolase/phosphoribosyl-ATP pyrophosphatase protein [Psychroflexus gondwanensis ACAM 44]TXE21001.1 bifunctional phosphoribosyl-AMP cyclohydrolase/phosphoribosyl-ATP diphosphatase HisIE [Psychroflexus gondwanensis]
MTIDFKKESSGLVPAIVQDANTKTVLMLGYMNEEAYKKTIETKLVTFYSRSKERLWTKGEESGHSLDLVDIKVDCDNDTLLVNVYPNGPTCHTGADTCWKEDNKATFGFLTNLESTIAQRKLEANSKESYVASLFEEGINKIAQKVGEEAVEVVIEAKDNDDNLFLNESADLLFHYLILLQQKGFQLEDVVDVLERRNKK